MSTFSELLAELQAVEGDPEKSKPIRAKLAARIDEVREYTDDLYALAATRKAQAAELLEAASARVAEADRILEGIQFYMVANNFEALPGNKWRLDLRANNPSVEIADGFIADAVLKKEYPDFVARAVVYSFDKKALAVAMKAGQTFPFCKLNDTKKHLEFEVRNEPAETSASRRQSRAKKSDTMGNAGQPPKNLGAPQIGASESPNP